MRQYREPRLVTRCRVHFERLDQEVVAESEDLSRHGVFVRTEELLPVGAVTELAIILPGEVDFRVIARVAHLLSPSSARALGRRTGMGFEFLESDNEGRAQLVDYLDDLIDERTPPPQPMLDAARVVVVDPSDPLLARLQESLERAGFVVDTHKNAMDAYQACVAAPPSVLLTEADTPDFDGWSLVKMMAAHPRLAEVPVVFMSADGSDMTRLQAYRLGVRDFVHKPFIEEELVIRLHRLVLSQPRGIGESVMLRGNLAEISVATLLSLLEFERKSGILLLLRDLDIARMFVAGGRVVKVESREVGLDPMARVMRVLDWKTGSFEFTGCEVVGTDEVGLNTTVLLLEHARITDEQSRGGDGER